MLGGPAPALAALSKKQEHRQHTGCFVPPCRTETLGTAEGGVENEGDGLEEWDKKDAVQGAFGLHPRAWCWQLAWAKVGRLPTGARRGRDV